MTTDPLLLLLADGRFPSGAHAHSFGLEAAVNAGLLAGVEDLSAWAVGCMHTTWLVDATAAVRAARLGEDVAQWVALDDEVQARLLSSHARTVSRTLGRQMLRTGRAIWPHVALRAAAAVHRDAPSAPLGLGAVTRAAGLSDCSASTRSPSPAWWRAWAPTSPRRRPVPSSWPTPSWPTPTSGPCRPPARRWSTCS